MTWAPLASGFCGSVQALLGSYAAFAVAILRYRSYEIDRIVSRTASHVLVLVLLGLVVSETMQPASVGVWIR